MSSRSRIILAWLGWILVLVLLIVNGFLVFALTQQQVGSHDLTLPLMEGEVDSEVAEGPWSVVLSRGPVQSDVPFSEGHLLLAKKEGTQVTVYERNPENLRDTALFDYEEAVEANNLGNLWAGLEPSVDTAANGEMFVYASADGLVLRSGRDERVLIRKLEGSLETEFPLAWDPPLERTFLLARPRISPDGEQVLFTQAHSEGSSYGRYSIESSQYTPIDPEGTPRLGGINVEWLSDEVRLFDFGFGGYNTMGIQVTEFDFNEVISVAEELGMPEFSVVHATHNRPNGNQVAALVAPEGSHGSLVDVVLTDLIGTQWRVLREDTTYSKLFYSQDGTRLYLIGTDKQLDSVVDTINLETGDVERVLNLPMGYKNWEFDRWTADGYLSLTTQSILSSSQIEPEWVHVILDLENRDVLYQSEPGPTHQRVLGFRSSVNK